MLGTQQADKLAGGEYDIYIMGTAAAHREEGSFAFFGNAGHDGNRADFLRLQALLLCKIGFCQRTENLLRRFGGGKVRHKVRVSFVDIAYPAGAAGGEHRPAMVLRILQMLQKLACFLHDGNVGSVAGVENIVEADFLQCCYHAAFSCHLGRQIEGFGPGGTYCRGNLYYGYLIGIGQYVINFGNVVTLLQRANGAVGDTLTAEAAVTVLNGNIAGNVYGSTGTGILHIPDMQLLHLVTNLDAAHAFDAFFGIADEREFLVPGSVDNIALIGNIVNAKVIGQSLQAAVAAAYAGCTHAVMLG